MEEKNNIEDLFADSKEYLETRIELAKLQAVEKSSQIAGSAVVGLLLLLLFSQWYFYLEVLHLHSICQKKPASIQQVF
jgi:hypothetical protein